MTEATQGSPGARGSTSELSTTTFKRLHPRTYLERFLSAHIREDGRLFSSWRLTSCVMGSIESAQGSCLVRMGITTVVAAVKAEITKPQTDMYASWSKNPIAKQRRINLLQKRSAERMTPPPSIETEEQIKGEMAGWLLPNVEITPMSSGRGRPGPPTEEAQAITDRLTEMLASPTRPIIDTNSLCIEPDVASWCLYLDISVICHDGNILDAALLAAVGALMNTRIPHATYDETKQPSVRCQKPTPSSPGAPLRLLSLPLTFSFSVYEGTHLLSDPSGFEGAFTSSSSTSVHGSALVGLTQWTEEGKAWKQEWKELAASMNEEGEEKADDEMEEDADSDESTREDLEAVAIQYLHTVGRCRAILPPDEQKDAKLTGLLTPAQLTHNCIAKARRRYTELRTILEKASNV